MWSCVVAVVSRGLNSAYLEKVKKAEILRPSIKERWKVYDHVSRLFSVGFGLLKRSF